MRARGRAIHIRRRRSAIAGVVVARRRKHHHPRGGCRQRGRLHLLRRRRAPVRLVRPPRDAAHIAPILRSLLHRRGNVLRPVDANRRRFPRRRVIRRPGYLDIQRHLVIRIVCRATFWLGLFLVPSTETSVIEGVGWPMRLEVRVHVGLHPSAAQFDNARSRRRPQAPSAIGMPRRGQARSTARSGRRGRICSRTLEVRSRFEVGGVVHDGSFRSPRMICMGLLFDASTMPIVPQPPIDAQSTDKVPPVLHLAQKP